MNLKRITCGCLLSVSLLSLPVQADGLLATAIDAAWQLSLIHI